MAMEVPAGTPMTPEELLVPSTQQSIWAQLTWLSSRIEALEAHHHTDHYRGPVLPLVSQPATPAPVDAETCRHKPDLAQTFLWDGSGLLMVCEWCHRPIRMEVVRR